MKYSSYLYLAILMMLLISIRIRISMNTYLKLVCLLCLLSLSFFTSFLVSTTIIKTVNFDNESNHLNLSWVQIFFPNLWIWMSRCMNRTYFEYYEFDVNVVLILFETCMNESEQLNFNIVDPLNISWAFMSSEKAIHCRFLMGIFYTSN